MNKISAFQQTVSSDGELVRLYHLVSVSIIVGNNSILDLFYTNGTAKHYKKFNS